MLSSASCSGRWNDEPVDEDAGSVDVRMGPAFAGVAQLACRAVKTADDQVVVRVDVVEWRGSDRPSTVDVVLEAEEKHYPGTVDLATGSTEVRGLDGEVLHIPTTPDVCRFDEKPTP